MDSRGRGYVWKLTERLHFDILSKHFLLKFMSAFLLKAHEVIPSLASLSSDPSLCFMTLRSAGSVIALVVRNWRSGVLQTSQFTVYVCVWGRSPPVAGGEGKTVRMAGSCAPDDPHTHTHTSYVDRTTTTSLLVQTEQTEALYNIILRTNPLLKCWD